MWRDFLATRKTDRELPFWYHYVSALPEVGAREPNRNGGDQVTIRGISGALVALALLLYGCGGGGDTEPTTEPAASDADVATSQVTLAITGMT